MSQPRWMEASHWPAAAGWTAVAVANGPGRGHLTGRILRRITGQRCTRCPWPQAYHRTGMMSTGTGLLTPSGILHSAAFLGFPCLRGPYRCWLTPGEGAVVSGLKEFGRAGWEGQVDR